ncbi:MAG: glutamate synthase [Lachnospiraceae bacterium]|nr:glutamate synthase [Lachnospiraceae bacterium]
MKVDITKLGYREVNEKLRENGDCTLTGALGQRFIGAGMSGKNITIEGTPGNALGAYLNGAEIVVRGNAQDAVGDTMNAGRIVVHGNIGDAAGYAMRGGRIYVRGNAGYRAGIHMKAYKEKVPVMVIGGSCGSFLGEYQAGGVIVVLGLQDEASKGKKIVGNFPCTGMHGGTMYLRTDAKDITFPWQVTARPAEAQDLAAIREYVEEYCGLFGCDADQVMDAPFTVVTPDSRNPYKQLYVAN